MKKFLCLILAAAFLASCNAQPKTNPGPEDRDERNRREQGSFFGGDGLTFGGSGRGKSDGAGVDGLAVNSYLWRASLDTLSFVPLAQVDPFGGVIISDWYSPPETPNERFKLTVYVLTRQLRSDGIRVAVFKQAREFSGEWRNIAMDDNTATQMENAILTRARQMRISLEKSPE